MRAGEFKSSLSDCGVGGGEGKASRMEDALLEVLVFVCDEEWSIRGVGRLLSSWGRNLGEGGGVRSVTSATGPRGGGGRGYAGAGCCGGMRRCLGVGLTDERGDGGGVGCGRQYGWGFCFGIWCAAVADGARSSVGNSEERGVGAWADDKEYGG